MTVARVLYVINGFNRGGAETGLCTMLEHGLLRGCDTRILALHEGAPELRAQIEALLPRGAVIVASPGSRLTLSGLLSGFLHIVRTVQRHRPHTVILSLKQANIVGRAALLAWPNIRCIAFEHIARLERGYLTPAYAVLLKLLSPRVDEIWADCPSTLIGARRYYLPRKRRARVVPLFLAGAQMAKSSYALTGPVRIVTAGRLVSRKRIDVLLAATARLREDGRAVRLTIFGEGPERLRLEALAASLGVAPDVVFAGFRPNWHLHGRDHDLCVHLSDDEGFCIVVAEAMSVGLPVIASPVGGVSDYSTHDKDALHARRAEASAVAGLIAALIGNESLRQRLGEEAARRITLSYGEAAARATYRAVTSDLGCARPSRVRTVLFGDVGFH